jgi:hypothetical protein
VSEGQTKQNEEKKDNVELSAEDLKQVNGGSDTVTMNKAKTADKVYSALDDYIKG